MERLNIAEKNHQDWFGGHYFSDQEYDPEFDEIVRKFLCGDVLVHGTLSNDGKHILPAADPKAQIASHAELGKSPDTCHPDPGQYISVKKRCKTLHLSA